LLILLVFCVWEARHATGVTYVPYASDSDEGIYTLSARLLARGYALFGDVFSSQPALFLSSLAVALRLVDDPLTAGHLYQALWGAVALIGVYWLAWDAYRPLAGPLAAALLAVTPGFLLYAHAVVAETPMLGLCVLAIAAAQAYYRSPRRRTVALAGVLLAAGTEMKLLSAVVVPPLALLLLGGAWRGRRAGRSRVALAADVGTFVLASVAPILLVLAVVAPADQVRQVFLFHLAASRALPLDPALNWDHLGGFLSRYDPGLLVLAGGGAVVGLRRARDRYLPLVYALWALTQFVFLLRYHPLAQHQFLPLLPPLALLGAALVTGLDRAPGPSTGRRTAAPLFARQEANAAHGWRRDRGRFARWWPALVVAVYAALLCVRALPADASLFVREPLPRRAALSALLDRVTRPGDVVVCDDPIVALGARRLTPPGLEDLSLVRAAPGYLTAPEAIAATRRYRPAAIVLSHPPQAALPPAYLSWVARRYRRVPSPVPGAQVYLSRR